MQSSKGTLLLAFILARHFPVSMLLILIDPAENHNTRSLDIATIQFTNAFKFQFLSKKKKTKNLLPFPSDNGSSESALQ